MNLFAIIGEALRALRQNRLRAGLTMLGMIIGVAAVVLMLSIGQGAQTKINQTMPLWVIFYCSSGAIFRWVQFGAAASEH
jgi:hypothetical protein